MTTHRASLEGSMTEGTRRRQIHDLSAGRECRDGVAGSHEKDTCRQ